MPLYTVYILSQKTWPFGEILCDLWLSLDYTACLCSICTLPLTRLLPAFGSYLCSIYTVFCITVDRFCSIRMPARYRVWRTKTKIRIPIERLSRNFRPHRMLHKIISSRCGYTLSALTGRVERAVNTAVNAARQDCCAYWYGMISARKRGTRAQLSKMTPVLTGADDEG